MTRPLDTECDTNRDPFLGGFSGRLNTFYILSVFDS